MPLHAFHAFWNKSQLKIIKTFIDIVDLRRKFSIKHINPCGEFFIQSIKTSINSHKSLYHFLLQLVGMEMYVSKAFRHCPEEQIESDGFVGHGNGLYRSKNQQSRLTSLPGESLRRDHLFPLFIVFISQGCYTLVPMKRFLPLAGLLLVPIVAVAALDYTDSSVNYIDAPFPRPEAVAISLLTNIGAVKGNPNGAFDADRALNRAEFLKIVLLSSGMVDEGSGRSCFPDVQATDWFSMYVCGGKDRGVVKGNPDGLYHPERPVNYAEALTMLVRLYKYDLTPQAGDEWYMVYARAASEHKTSLPISLSYDEPLTRGQMARLASAFLAEHEGSLAEFRALELGTRVSSRSSSSKSGSGSSVSSGSGVSVSSSVSSAKSSTGSSVSSQSSSSLSSSQSSSSSVVWFPSQSRFLIVGMKSAPVIDGTFKIDGEDGILRIVQFTLRTEVHSIDKFILVDDKKTEIATLALDTNDNANHLKWRVDIVGDNGYRLKNGVATQLGLIAVLKTNAAGGAANELFDAESLSMRVQGATTGETKQIVPSNVHTPLHQTANGRVTAVRNAGSGVYMTQKGQNRLLARFSFSAIVSTGSSITVQSVNAVVNTVDTSVTHIRIGGTAEIQQADCSINRTDKIYVTCPVIPASLATITKGPIELSLIGDTDLRSGVNSGTLQVQFLGTGQIGVEGAIRWGDQTGSYNWLEAGTPLESGTLWTVKN